MPDREAVLLIAFGGPEKAADVRPFLDEVLRGRPVPRARYEEVVHHYELIGGYSPMNALTFAQARALTALLEAEGRPLPVYVGLRHSSPTIAEALTRLSDDDVRHAIGIILAPHRTEASWERYIAAVDAARETLGAAAPDVTWAGPWFDDPLFVTAVASRTRDAFEALGGAERTAVVFTAHSIPRAMADASPYVRQLEASCRLVAAEVGVPEYTLGYQSRSGNPRDPWLEPDVNDVIHALAARGARGVAVVPIGFVCDHVEVLYDLDVEARATATAAGMQFARAGTVNDHPAFIRMLAELVRRQCQER